MAAESSSGDTAIAEYLAAARRRQVHILFAAAAVCLLIGAMLLVVTLTLGADISDSDTSVYQAKAEGGVLKTVLAGAGFLVAGFGLGWKGIRIRHGATLGLIVPSPWAARSGAVRQVAPARLPGWKPRSMSASTWERPTRPPPCSTVNASR